MTLKSFELTRGALKGKRILVTGATGFVGGRLAERLVVEEGAMVRALIRSWHKAVWLSRFDVQLCQGDIGDSECVARAAKDCDLVIHCANGGGSADEYWKTNVGGMKNVIEACVENGISRLVFISSIAVHGSNPPDGANEADEYRPQGNAYAESKVAAEKLALEAHRSSRLEVTILRPTFVWGPRSMLFTVGPLRQMAAGQFRLVDGGFGKCHAVFIETVVDAIIAASIKREALGRCFLVTDGFDINWRQFFQPLAELLGIQELLSVSSSSVIFALRCEVYAALREQLEQWKGHPAPLWKRVSRRTARIVADTLAGRGVMAIKDLKKFAHKGNLNTSSTTSVLEIRPRYSFDEASAITRDWALDQLAYDLPLKTH